MLFRVQREYIHPVFLVNKNVFASAQSPILIHHLSVTIHTHRLRQCLWAWEHWAEIYRN